jgi:hypothetical protein
MSAFVRVRTSRSVSIQTRIELVPAHLVSMRLDQADIHRRFRLASRVGVTRRCSDSSTKASSTNDRVFFRVAWMKGLLSKSARISSSVPCERRSGLSLFWESMRPELENHWREASFFVNRTETVARLSTRTEPRSGAGIRFAREPVWSDLGAMT